MCGLGWRLWRGFEWNKKNELDDKGGMSDGQGEILIRSEI